MPSYLTDRTLVPDALVDRLKGQRKRIPSKTYVEVLEWSPIMTADFVLTRWNPKAKKREFLLAKRSEEPFKGTWFVAGGRVSWGESLEEACLRQLERELGVTGRTPRFKGHLSVMNPASDDRPLWHSIWHLYEVKVPFSLQVTPRAENSEVRWFSEIQRSFPAPVKEALRMLGFA